MSNGIKGSSESSEEKNFEVDEEHPDKVYEEGSRKHREPREYSETGERGPRVERRSEHWAEGTEPGEHRGKRRGEHRSEPRGREAVDETSAEIWAGGSTFEAIAGAGAVVLTILGLVEISPALMLSVATIAVGVGIMFGGASIAAKYRQALNAMDAKPSEYSEMGGGLSTEIIGGAAGAVLGLLALLNVANPFVLIPAAVIAVGGALLFGAGATNRMRDVTIRQTSASRSSQQFASESIGAAANAQVFIGIGAAALGIIALAGIGPPVTLSLIGVLALGSSMLISGAALGGRMMQRFAY